MLIIVERVSSALHCSHNESHESLISVIPFDQDIVASMSFLNHIEVVDTWELPPVLIERYNAAGGEGTALCGIFPEIRRAWATVDNSLFLWPRQPLWGLGLLWPLSQV
ncbi:hypothetical protein U1Q18_002016 [Sarracenia purpurea var. burkii]